MKINGNAIKPATRKMLKDYVENGGSLLLLGGYGSDFALSETFTRAIPLMLNVPEAKPIAGTEKESIFAAYGNLFRALATMGRENPNLLKFLIASAVYRDGLNGVFAYGAVLHHIDAAGVELAVLDLDEDVVVADGDVVGDGAKTGRELGLEPRAACATAVRPGERAGGGGQVWRSPCLR